MRWIVVAMMGGCEGGAEEEVCEVSFRENGGDPTKPYCTCRQCGPADSPGDTAISNEEVTVVRCTGGFEQEIRDRFGLENADEPMHDHCAAWLADQ